MTDGMKMQIKHVYFPSNVPAGNILFLFIWEWNIPTDYMQIQYLNGKLEQFQFSDSRNVGGFNGFHLLAEDEFFLAQNEYFIF